MASESVKILIEAEDKASAQVANASRNIEQAVKGVKETGQRAKGSIEFVGVLAGQLGGGQLQTAAQGVAAITEKVGQFSEVMKAGGQGAAFFQAGIAALVGVMSFSLGKSIGEAIFGVRDLAAELRELEQEFAANKQRIMDLANASFGEKMEDIRLIKDPAKQQAEAAALFQQIKTQQDTAAASFVYYADEAEKLREKEKGSIFGLSEAEQDRLHQLNLMADEQARLAENANAQLVALSKDYGPRAQSIKAIKDQEKAEQEAAAKKKAIDDSALSSLRSINYQYLELTKGKEAAQRQQLKDQGMTDIQIEQLAFAQRALDVEKKLADQKTQNQEKEKERLQKISDLRKSELEKLEEQKALLEKGEKAAHVFKLTQEGIDQGTAEQIANAQAAIEAAKKPKATVQPISAVESRFLTRGPQQDKMSEVAKNTKLTAEQSAAINLAIENLRKEVEKDRVDKAKKDTVNINIVGRGA